MIRILLLAVLGFGVVALTGCAEKKVLPAHIYSPKPVADIIKTSYIAADALISQIGTTLPATEAQLIVATLVNINRLDESSPFGRLVSEQIANRFTQNGYRIVETKLRNQLYMKRQEGELTLSREVRDIAKKHSVRAVVSGTYTDGSDRIYVSLKLIEIDNNIVMAAFDYFLEKDSITRSLFGAS